MASVGSTRPPAAASCPASQPAAARMVCSSASRLTLGTATNPASSRTYAASSWSNARRARPSLESASAVDGDDLAGHPAGPRRGEELDAVGDVGGLTEAAGGDAGDQRALALRAVALPLQLGRGVGQDEAGRDAVDGDPAGPSSWAICRVNPIMPAFALAYAWIPVLLTVSPAAEAMLTMRPSRAPSCPATTARVQWKAVVRFALTTACQSSSGTSSSGCRPGRRPRRRCSPACRPARRRRRTPGPRPESVRSAWSLSTPCTVAPSPRSAAGDAGADPVGGTGDDRYLARLVRPVSAPLGSSSALRLGAGGTVPPSRGRSGAWVP